MHVKVGTGAIFNGFEAIPPLAVSALEDHAQGTSNSVLAAQVLSVTKMNRVTPLTGLRGLAAYSVLLAHLIISDYQAQANVEFAGRLSHFGMSLFFILSGFVIYYNYAETVKTGRGIINFFVARFARLYPLYFIVIIIYIALFHWMPHSTVTTPLTIVSHITLTQSWINTQEAVFTATWSISTEWFFYIAFVVFSLGGLLSKINNPTRCTIIFVLFSLITLCVVFTLAPLVHFSSLGAFEHGMASAPVWYWLAYYCPWIRIFEFGLGVLLSMTYRAGQVRIRHFTAFIGSIWCILVIFADNEVGNNLVRDILLNFVWAPALAIVVLYCSDQKNLIAQLLSSSTAIFTGEISYSVYLLHFICHALCLQFVAPGIVDVMLSIALTTGVAFLSYRLIEVPARRLIQHWARACGLYGQGAEFTPQAPVGAAEY